MRYHQIYWFTTEDSNGDSIAADCYYLKDARRQARKLAEQLKTDIYINQGENIIDVVFYEKADNSKKNKRRY